MATETTVDTYTGVQGVVTYGGNPFAYCEFDLQIERDTASIPRGGKWSDINLPGKVKVTGKLKYGLVDGDLFCDALDDGTNTTTTAEETLHAAIAGTAAEQLITAGLTDPSVPMHIKLKIISSDGYAAGAIRIEGTDANDAQISEVIPYIIAATGATTVYYYGHQTFKTVTAVRLGAGLTTNDTVTVYGAGQKSVTIGSPKLVTIVGKLADGSAYDQVTLTNCFLTKMPFKMSDANEAVLPEQEFMVRDPDADVTFTTDA